MVVRFETTSSPFHRRSDVVPALAFELYHEFALGKANDITVLGVAIGKTLIIEHIYEVQSLEGYGQCSKT